MYDFTAEGTGQIHPSTSVCPRNNASRVFRRIKNHRREMEFLLSSSLADGVPEISDAFNVTVHLVTRFQVSRRGESHADTSRGSCGDDIARF